MNLCEIPRNLYDFGDKTNAIFIKVYLEKHFVHSSSERMKMNKETAAGFDRFGSFRLGFDSSSADFNRWCESGLKPYRELLVSANRLGSLINRC